MTASGPPPRPSVHVQPLVLGDVPRPRRLVVAGYCLLGAALLLVPTVIYALSHRAAISADLFDRLIRRASTDDAEAAGRLADLTPNVLVPVAIALAMLQLAGFAVLVARRRGWLRVVVIVLALLGLLVTVGCYPVLAAESAAVAAFGIGQAVLLVAAIAVLCTGPVSRWLRG